MTTYLRQQWARSTTKRVADVATAAARGAGEALDEFGPRPVVTSMSGVGQLGEEAKRVAAATRAAAKRAKEALRAGRTEAPEYSAYTAVYEHQLSPDSYPGSSRQSHFREANEALLQAMEGDADFARLFGELGVDLRRTTTGLAPRKSPSNWTWHHNMEPGVMHLVPSYDQLPGTPWSWMNTHVLGSPWWPTMHSGPRGGGGMAAWGVR